MTAAYEQLFATASSKTPEPLYNALENSDLRLQGINIVDGHASVHVVGQLELGGACDAPRVRAQLEQTALQFRTVNTVSIQINGTPLQEVLSAQT